MDFEGKKFGRGPRELTGAVDLIKQYRLLPHYEFFCKKPLPLSISDTYYLHNVVGDTEIRKGEGMELNQLLERSLHSRDPSVCIQPLDMDILREAFQLRDSTPVDLPLADRGIPALPGKSKSESKDKKHKRHKDKDKDRDKEHKKHKHRNKDKEMKKDKSGQPDSNTKRHEKKRKHEGNEDLAPDVHRHKKSKHKSTKIDDVAAIKVAG